MSAFGSGSWIMGWCPREKAGTCCLRSASARRDARLRAPQRRPHPRNATKPLALAAALLLASNAAALAQRSGTYAVEGRGADGQRYEGSLQLQATGPQTWRIIWRIAGETATGGGLTVGNMLCADYVSQRETGVVCYEAMPDGRLVGRWTQGREGGVGTETLLPR
jgi:hypothetical protein